MHLFSLTWLYGGNVFGGLQENGTTLTHAPSSCAVYRNTTTYDVDRCSVRGPTARREASWTLEAAWENTEEASFVPGRGAGSIRIVAFNGTQPIAWWQGQFDRNDFSEAYA